MCEMFFLHAENVVDNIQRQKLSNFVTNTLISDVSATYDYGLKVNYDFSCKLLIPNCIIFLRSPLLRFCESCPSEVPLRRPICSRW